MSAEHEGRIALAVMSEALRRRVKLEPVDFDEKTIVDEHVDAPDASQCHLLPNRASAPLQPVSGE